MSQMYKILTNQVCEVSRNVASFMQGEQKKLVEKKVEIKELNSLVSYVDRAAEQMIVDQLSKLLPHAGFITEENTVAQQRQNEFVWIVDPLDGTTNYIHQLPFYSISIALMHGEKLVLGVIYDCGLNDLYSAYDGGGAVMNGQPIYVRREPGLHKSLLATGFPYRDYGRLESFMKLLHRTFHHTRGVRRLGSAALDLAYTAAGRFDLFFEYGLNAWDVAAGIVLVHEAGGRVTDFSGGSQFLFGGEIVAGQPFVFDEFLKWIEKSGLK
ncbi:inositol-1-monophosphatase [Schleiferia thermophila str. Yellowstone]|jgi:myo-inositol-1(or 4)-monophosphatase|uniref:inositol monophosphatase family protein n=1 Tax=Schleiferia thermophila TaxID=884107 RepID=UPI0004E6A455|nr:inositol-1-monophosphatase [Schleiferia thermophila str. Yellowstone]